ncbi:hypothetical protein CVS40_11382 [Lucilia cuprina]|nr:hypothetical protein CVS40_11382 [Lucilia cuprina]
MQMQQFMYSNGSNSPNSSTSPHNNCNSPSTTTSNAGLNNNLASPPSNSPAAHVGRTFRYNHPPPLINASNRCRPAVMALLRHLPPPLQHLLHHRLLPPPPLQTHHQQVVSISSRLTPPQPRSHRHVPRPHKMQYTSSST